MAFNNSCAVSADGMLCIGGCFADVYGARSPCTFEMLPDAGHNDGRYMEPYITSFSSFSSKKVTAEDTQAKNRRKGYEAGNHVGACFNNTNTFFSALMLRCDTWAVQWAVGRSGCLENASVTQLAVLNAHLLCGVYTVPDGKPSVFLASRLDIPRVSKASNREWRSFIAPPRTLVTGLEDEGIVRVIAADFDSVFVLTGLGNIFLLELNTSTPNTDSNNESRIRRKLPIVSLGKRKAEVTLAVTNTAHSCLLAAYSKGSSSLEIVDVSMVLLQSEGRCPVRTVSFPAKSQICDVKFVGPFGAVVTFSTPALQLVSITRRGSGHDAEVDVALSNLLPLPDTPVAGHYNATSESYTIICSRKDPHSRKHFTYEERLSVLTQCTVPLTGGRFTAEALLTATWAPVSNPFHHYGPRTALYEGSDDDVDRELQGDLQILRASTDNEGRGRWVPLQLHYVLAAGPESAVTTNSVEVAVFSVTTAPHNHTRLIKQWHNATAGLKVLFDKCDLLRACPFALPWNPRHLRRALRLMTQQQLSFTFHNAATALREGTAVPAGADQVIYCEVATAAIDVAMHIITLSGQTGATLRADDVEAIALLLRASREAGHEVLRSAARMELLMESCLQQRAVNRLLGRQKDRIVSGEEGVTVLQSDFFGIPDEVQTERTLHTRYTANTWVQRLEQNRAHHVSVAEGAAKYLAQLSMDDVAPTVCDWGSMGKRPHKDAILSQFESSLIQ